MPDVLIFVSAAAGETVAVTSYMYGGCSASLETHILCFTRSLIQHTTFGTSTSISTNLVFGQKLFKVATV